jgi:hypothetical protein
MSSGRSALVSVALLVGLGSLLYVIGVRPALDRLHREPDDDNVHVQFAADPDHELHVLNPRFREYNPTHSLYGTSTEEAMVILDTNDGHLVATLPGVSEIAWVTNDRLVAVRADGLDGFGGLAVVDLHNRKERQVDTHGRTETTFHVVDADHDDITLCQWTYGDGGSGAASCGPETWVLDTTTADLGPALVLDPMPPD